MITRIGVALIALLAISACANQQALINVGYANAQQAKAEAVGRCATSTDVQGCMLGAALIFGGGAGDSLPVAQSTLSTVLNSSLLGTVAGAGIGAVRDIKVAQSQERQNIAATQANAATQAATYGAFASVAGAGYSAITQTTQSGFTATTTIAQAGFDAASVGLVSLERLGSTAVNASAQTAQAITRMPPTYQAGGDIVGRDYVRDESATGRDRVQGNANETARNVTCQAQGGNGGGTNGNGGTGGATGPGGAANPGAGDAGQANNNCGG